MKKKEILSSDASGSELPEQKKRQRHIVSWSSEEDEILREQIRLHGTENWVIIASKFKDKSTRQCRRRWFTYLNSDFKRGGWSPEEDMLLCEAQKIFGNRWTEIAKVVSGRTDNAVKNRFTTLCKRREKHEEAERRSSGSALANANNQIVFPSGISADGGSETTPSLKRKRMHISDTSVNRVGEASGENVAAKDLHTLVSESACRNITRLPTQQQLEEKSLDTAENKGAHLAFLSKDDPKLLALMQQAELLSSLAIKVNSEQTDESLEDAWTALEDFLKQTKMSHRPASRNPDDDCQLDNCNEAVENEGSTRDHYESSVASSEYSSGSTLPSSDKTEVCQGEICLPQHENSQEFEAHQSVNKHSVAEVKYRRLKPSRIEVGNMLACSDVKCDDGTIAYGCPNTEFDSPIHVNPLFRALAAAIPSPKFSESEKNFLMKTLGTEPTSPRPIMNPSQPPACKRSLLHCL